MIHTRRTVTVGNNSSTIDNPIVLYRGDREVEVEFVIMGNKFTFSNGGNVIKSTHATLGQLVINTPTGLHMFSEVTECQEGSVIFTISKEMIDELIEVGFYSFQIRLFDATQLSRVTIPPVFEGIDIRTPIAAEDENNMVDSASVGYAVIQNHILDDDILDTFNFDGQYNITRWMNGDRITSGKLNKIEDALLNINNTALIDHADMKKAIENNYALLESNKANKSDVADIKNQLDNLVIESSGDSNPEVVQARNGETVLWY